MKVSKVVLDFMRMGDSILETKALTILAAMTGNANFETPIPALEALNTAFQNYSNALSAAKTRDKVKVSVKNDMRAALRLILTDLSHYVNFIAKGDRTIIMSSGFTASSENRISRVVTLGEPANFSVEQGKHSGEVTLSVEPVEGADTYLFLYAPAPVTNDLWAHKLSDFPSITLTDLESMKQYSFRIAVAGGKNESAYTIIITRAIA